MVPINHFPSGTSAAENPAETSGVATAHEHTATAAATTAGQPPSTTAAANQPTASTNHAPAAAIPSEC